jgi:hypothetical protein
MYFIFQPFSAIHDEEEKNRFYLIGTIWEKTNFDSLISFLPVEGAQYFW